MKTGAGEPTREAFAGDRLPMRRFLLATRPAFFSASALPVLLGTAWGARVAAEFDLPAFLLALGATLTVHAAANVWNDVEDDKLGGDAINEDRVYPYTGGSRFIQNGVIERGSMASFAVSLACCAVLQGLLLVQLKGPTVLLIGACGAGLGFIYSLPAFQRLGHGLAELAVASAFGIIPVCGAAWLQSGVFDAPALLIAVPVSCWVTAILLINELPDRTADRACGKMTLAVALGPEGVMRLYALVHGIALLAVTFMALRSDLPIITAAGIAAVTAIALAVPRTAASGASGGLKRSIQVSLGLHTIGCLWLMGCILV